MKRGKLIVLDGADGSGKATQTAPLVKRLKKQGRKVKTIDFPRYENNFFGKLVGECLAGKYGDFIGLDAHIASVFYAADRFESKKDIEKWLKEGCIVVADRYVSANQIHQGSKITHEKKRREFLKWLDQMEFGVFGLPRPDVILYLDVPREISDRLLGQKKQGASINRSVKGKKDLAESDKLHLDASRKSALKLVAESNAWIRIQCAKKNELLSREAIAEMVWEQVKKMV